MMKKFDFIKNKFVSIEFQNENQLILVLISLNKNELNFLLFCFANIFGNPN